MMLVPARAVKGSRPGAPRTQATIGQQNPAGRFLVARKFLGNLSALGSTAPVVVWIRSPSQ